MLKILKSPIFHVNFDESVKEYGKKDGILALLYFVYDSLILFAFGQLMFQTNLLNKNRIVTDLAYKTVFYLPYMIISVMPAFIILKFRKQKLKSIGIKKEKNGRSIILGILLSIPMIFLLMILPLFPQILKLHISKLNGPNLAWSFIYFFVDIAFPEELVCRAFIQTRIQGLIKSKWLSIFIVGAMFSICHIPFHMVQQHVTFLYYFRTHLYSLTMQLLSHIYFVYLYTRYNNILSSTIAHTLYNFISVFFSTESSLFVVWN